MHTEDTFWDFMVNSGAKFLFKETYLEGDEPNLAELLSPKFKPSEKLNTLWINSD